LGKTPPTLSLPTHRHLAGEVWGVTPKNKCKKVRPHYPNNRQNHRPYGTGAAQTDGVRRGPAERPAARLRNRACPQGGKERGGGQQGIPLYITETSHLTNLKPKNSGKEKKGGRRKKLEAGKSVPGGISSRDKLKRKVRAKQEGGMHNRTKRGKRNN